MSWKSDTNQSKETTKKCLRMTDKMVLQWLNNPSHQVSLAKKSKEGKKFDKKWLVIPQEMVTIEGPLHQVSLVKQSKDGSGRRVEEDSDLSPLLWATHAHAQVNPAFFITLDMPQPMELLSAVDLLCVSRSLTCQQLEKMKRFTTKRTGHYQGSSWFCWLFGRTRQRVNDDILCPSSP